MANIKQNNHLTSYELFQLERYGNIIPDISHTPEDNLLESGIEEINRLSAWTESMADNQLQEVAA